MPGLSNFNEEQIREILAVCEVRPVVLQTELHPYLQEAGLRKFLAAERMQSRAGTRWATETAPSCGSLFAALDKEARYFVFTPEMLEKFAAFVSNVDGQK